MWFRRGNAAKPFTPIVGAYGKLPRFGDFVGVRANVEPATSYQAWLARALDWAERRQLPGWPTLFEEGPVAFTFRPRPGTGSILVGAIRASQDAVGRRFPFTIFGSVSEEAAAQAPHLMPIAIAGFVERAEQLLREIDVVSTTQEIENWIATMPPIGIDESAANAYATWCERTRLSDLWLELYGSSEPEAPKYALQMLSAAIAPFRGLVEPQTQLGARLPLGRASNFEAGLWIELAWRLNGGRSHPPTTFCSIANPKTLFLSLGETHVCALGEATSGVGDTDEVCDLTSAPTSPVRLPPLPDALEHEVASPTLPISQLVRTVAGLGAGEGNGARGRISLS